MTKEELREKRNQTIESLNYIKATLGLDELYIDELEKENKLLGERCNQLLADKGKLTDELDEWKSEWIDQVIKANEEGFARTLQTMQLTKATEIIKKYLAIGVGGKITQNYLDVIKEAEQFLKGENIILEDAQAGNSSFDADEVFNKEMKAYPEEKVK